nr:immunoglobulin heavy chain junction region [Mus musculus]
CARMGFAYW